MSRPWNLAADAAQCRCRQHTLGRAAAAHVDVDAGTGPRGGDHAGHVAVADQADPGTGIAHGLDQLLVARAVEDEDHHLLDRNALGLGDAAQILGRGRVDGDDAGRQAAADRDLVHVDVGRVEEAAGRRHGDAGDGVGSALGGDRGPFQGVEGDVDLGALAGAHPLADEEHRRLVALALADHDRAVDVEDVERLAHGVDRRLVGRLLVAAPHQPGAGEGGCLGHPDAVQRQVAILALILPHSPPPLS